MRLITEYNLISNIILKVIIIELRVAGLAVEMYFICFLYFVSQSNLNNAYRYVYLYYTRNHFMLLCF